MKLLKLAQIVEGEEIYLNCPCGQKVYCKEELNTCNCGKKFTKEGWLK